MMVPTTARTFTVSGCPWSDPWGDPQYTAVGDVHVVERQTELPMSAVGVGLRAPKLIPFRVICNSLPPTRNSVGPLNTEVNETTGESNEKALLYVPITPVTLRDTGRFAPTLLENATTSVVALDHVVVSDTPGKIPNCVDAVMSVYPKSRPEIVTELAAEFTAFDDAVPANEMTGASNVRTLS